MVPQTLVMESALCTANRAIFSFFATPSLISNLAAIFAMSLLSRYFLDRRCDVTDLLPEIHTTVIRVIYSSSNVIACGPAAQPAGQFEGIEARICIRGGVVKPRP